MEIDSAIKLVNHYLRESENEMNSFGSGLPDYVNPEIELQIITSSTQEHDFGWVFFYNSKKYLDSGDFRDALAGNSPLIIDRESGQLFETGTAHEIDYYISNFKNTGNPNNEESA